MAGAPMTLSEDAIVRGLVEKGVPRPVAEREAKRQRGDLLPPQRFGVPDRVVPPPPMLIARPSIAWPVRLLLPWSYLVSDNERKEPYIVHTANGPKAQMRLTTRYANALQKIQLLAKGKLDDAAPYAGPLAIDVRVWFPGGSSRNDGINFSKIVHDALEGVVYTNDNWLHVVHWERVGVDVDSPRAEITLSPLSPATPP